MAVKTDIGVRAYPAALAAATITYQPQFDRSGLVRRLVVENPSADDNWTVTVGGKEIVRFRVLTGGNQRLLLIPTAGTSWQPNFFDWVRNVLGLDPAIPVPGGLQCVVASVGGATADIVLEVEEHDFLDMNTLRFNHYLGTDFLLPIYMRLAAGQAAAGTFTLDTEDSPAWVPNLMAGAGLPVGWAVDILAVLTEGMGVNTFSGAANHQSTTRSLVIIRNGEPLFVHPSIAPNAYLAGVPNRGSDSAAGSANTVFGQRSAVYPPFQQTNDFTDAKLDFPITLRPGDQLTVQHDIQGDLTGTASYARALQVLLCKIKAPGGIGVTI